MNCWERPKGIDAVVGETEMDVNTGGAMARVPDPVKPPKLALIVVPPCAILLAKPAEVIVATLVTDELQATMLVKSSVEPVL